MSVDDIVAVLEAAEEVGTKATAADCEVKKPMSR